MAYDRFTWLFAAVLGFTRPIIAAPDANFFSTDPNWTDDVGVKHALSEFKGTRLVMTMAYADCDRICPMSLDTLKEIEARLTKKNGSATFLVFTLNPVVDTTDGLAKMRQKLGVGSNWYFLRGTEAATNALAQQLEMGKIDLDDHILHKFKIWCLRKDGTVEKTLDWNHRKLGDFP